VSDARAGADGEAAAPPTAADGPIPLTAPRAEQRSYRPLSGSFGGVHELPDLVALDGIDTPEGYLAEGRVQIEFTGDGTSDPASLVLADADGRSLALVVEPLADSVWFRRD
jgi:hypothetical protein